MARLPRAGARRRLEAGSATPAGRREGKNGNPPDRLAKISKDSELLLRRIEAGEDVDPEPYLDIGIIDWLPRR